MKICIYCHKPIDSSESHGGRGPAEGATEFFHDLCFSSRNTETSTEETELTPPRDLR